MSQSCVPSPVTNVSLDMKLNGHVSPVKRLKLIPVKLHFPLVKSKFNFLINLSICHPLVLEYHELSLELSLEYLLIA